MQHQLTEYMERKGIMVMCTQETRMASTTQFLSKGYLFINFGGGGNKEYAGVGYIVHPKLIPAIKYVHNEGARIAELALAVAGRDIFLYSVYVPQSGRPPEERQGTFDILDKLLQSSKSKGVAVIAGDYNAR
eukprot:3114907-Alexandrium_andersonii.AAC.1